MMVCLSHWLIISDALKACINVIKVLIVLQLLL